MTKKHILLVDGNSITHANQNGTVLSVGGFQVQALFGVLRSMYSLLKNTPGQKELLFLWDGKAQFRIDLYPEYKGNRAPMDAKQEAHQEARKRQMPFIEKSLTMLGVKQVRSPLLEADDLAGFLVPRLVAAGHQVTMVSGDKDWLQLVGPSVSWFDPIRDRRCDPDNFLEFTGYFNTDAFLHGKALQGDSSDNVGGIPWMGEKGAAVFMAQWKSVYAFFKAVDNGSYTPKVSGAKSTRIHPETFLASPEGRAVFERNVKLMDWRLSRQPQTGEMITTPGAFNPAAFELICQRFAFASILRELSMFLKTFNPQYIKETV